MIRASALVAVLLMAACSTTRGLGLKPGSVDTVAIMPVQNLAGVSLMVPEMYVGDMAGDTDALEIEFIDLGLLAEAALTATLRGGGWQLTDPAEARYHLHAAITEYDATDLRRTARYRMAVVLILVDQKGREVTRGGAVREFQLFSKPPHDVGALGDERFVRRKLEGFTETLVREAVTKLGLG
jgi:hypothetical protein